jgi:hypothetical protein
VTRPSPCMTAMGGEDDALARSALAGAFGPEGAPWSSRSARAGGSRIPSAGAAHSGLQAAAPELAAGPLVRWSAGPQALQPQPERSPDRRESPSVPRVSVTRREQAWPHRGRKASIRHPGQGDRPARPAAYPPLDRHRPLPRDPAGQVGARGDRARCAAPRPPCRGRPRSGSADTAQSCSKTAATTPGQAPRQSSG